MNKKLTANTSKDIPKFWERSVRRKSDLDFIRLLWSTFSIYMVQTFLKTLLRRFIVSRSELLFISSAISSCRIRNLSTFSMLVCYNAKKLFSEKFFTHAYSGLFTSLIKVWKVFQFLMTSSFWSFIVWCSSLILLIPNITPSKELFRYATSISRYTPSLVLDDQLSRQHVLYCSGSAYSDCTKDCC